MKGIISDVLFSDFSGSYMQGFFFGVTALEYENGNDDMAEFFHEMSRAVVEIQCRPL